MNTTSNTQAKPVKKLALHKESILLLQPGQQAQGQGYVSAGCFTNNGCYVSATCNTNNSC